MTLGDTTGQLQTIVGVLMGNLPTGVGIAKFLVSMERVFITTVDMHVLLCVAGAILSVNVFNIVATG